MEEKVERLYITDAPDEYDWSFTHTVDPNWGTTRRGRPIRLVSMTAGMDMCRHQRDRYGSGLFMSRSLDEPEEIALDVSSGLYSKNEGK